MDQREFFQRWRRVRMGYVSRKTLRPIIEQQASVDNLYHPGPDPLARDTGVVYGSLDRGQQQYGQQERGPGRHALSEDGEYDYDSPYKKRLDAAMDKRIVTHLRRKLNRRMERRINKLVENELQKDRNEQNRAPSRHNSASVRSPFDPTNSYTEFGEKIRPTPKSRPSTNRADDASLDLNQKTPLPEIPKVVPTNSKRKGATSKTVNADDILTETQKGVTGSTFGLTGFTRGETFAEDGDMELSEQVPNGRHAQGDEEPVSPVPTPLVHRPDTRQAGNLTFHERRGRLLEGDVTVPVKPKPKLLKVFIQSSFSDSELERTKLLETVFPKLRSFGQERGFDLHLVDPFWAHRDFTCDSHNDVDVMCRLLNRCQEHQQGVNFMIFLGQKLGDPLLPSSIPTSDFSTLVAAASREREDQVSLAKEKAAVFEAARKQRELEKALEHTEEGPSDAATAAAQQTTAEQDGTRTDAPLVKEPSDADLRALARKEASFLRTVRENSPLGDVDPDLLRTWYRLDENASPPVYRLQPISSQFKDILSTDPGRRAAAEKSWKAVANRLRAMIQLISKQEFAEDPTRGQKYQTTLAEVLLSRGFSRDRGDVGSHSVWFYRHIDDLHLGSGDEIMRDYQDTLPLTLTPNQDAQTRLKELTCNTIPDTLSKSNVKRYKVSWHHRGVNMGFREHANYVDRLCKDFTDVISRAVEELETSSQQDDDGPGYDDLYREVEQHVNSCQKRSQMFQGRKNLLQEIKRYVRSTAPYPLVLYGQSGCGKTSLIAKSARDSHKWIKGSRCVTVVRMIGVTAASTNVRMLLRYICLQLCEVFGDDPEDVPHDYKGLFNNFNFRLSKADEQHQLVIFLDSLHKLTDENEGRKMAWLPTELPPYVRLIVSTLPDDDSVCFKALKRMIPDEHRECFLEINELPSSDAGKVLDYWLKKADRAVTKEQRDVLMHNYRQCQQPLYLRVLFNEALSWPSYLAPSDIRLGSAVKNLATVIFGRLEKNHGEVLVRRALGYLSAARSGLTESEMEDVLSLDDAVMAEVMNHVKPPLRRLPSLLWVRIREDLGEYVEETNADGCVTLKWSNIQFAQAAEDRYLMNRDRAPSYHKALAEYFSDMWTDAPKPYQGNEKGVLRFTMGQPLYRESHNKQTKTTHRVYNLRRLNELPYHFLNSQQMEALKSECLCNFEFVMAKISGVTLRALFEDFQMALTVDSADADLKLLSDTLHLSVEALSKDPRQLASQVIGRLHMIITKDVPVSYGDPVKYPFLKPFFSQAQEGSIPALIPSRTCLTPPGGILFDLLSGHTEALTAVCMSPDGQKCVTTSKDNTLKLWLLKNGRVMRTIVGVGNNVLQIQIGGNNAIAMTSEVSMIRFWSLRSGDCLKVIKEYSDPATIVTASEGLLLAAFYHGTNVMRVWTVGGKFSLHQEVFLDEEESSSGAIHQDNSTIVASNSHGPLVLHAFKSASTAMARNAKNGNVIHKLKIKDSGSITAMACTPEYFVIVARYNYMQLHEMICLDLFDNRNGAYIRQIRGCTEDIIGELYVNHMGSHAVGICYSEANNSSDIALWNLETQEHKHLARHAKISKRGACIDLRYCLTISEGENTLRIWNLSGNVNQPGVKVKVKEGLESIIQMKDNSRYVVAKAMNNGPISVWNIAKGKCAGNAVHIERGLVNATDVMLVRNTKVLILTEKGFSSVSEDRPPVFQTLLIYDLLKKKYVQKLNKCYITPCPAHEYIFLEDDHVMGLADNRSHLVVWSTVTGHVINRIKPNYKEFELKKQELGIVDYDEIRRQHNSTAMMTPWDRRTETKSARERRRQAEIEEQKTRLDDLKREKDNVIQQYLISKDLSTVVTSHYAHHMCVFDVTSQTHTQMLENYSCIMLLYTAALSPNGSHLVHTNYDEMDKISYVTLWDCKTGQVRKRLKNEKNVCCMDINEGGRRIVFGKSSKELRVWEPRNGNVMKRVRGYGTLNFGLHSQIHMIEGGLKAVVYAGDISIWDLVKCEVLAVFTPDVRIQSFTLAMDGKLIVFGIQDTSDVVTLQLKFRDHSRLQKTGKDLFGEVDSSDEDDDELEAQLEQE